MRPRDLRNELTRSAKTLKSVRSLTVIGMLLAVQVILGLFTIPIGHSIQITFDYLPLWLTGLLFGPVPATLTGALSDLIVYLIRPTGPFNPGFTLSAALSGFIYGLLLYRRDCSFRSLAVSRLIAVVVCNVLLNSCWLLLLYGAGALLWIPGRILKNVIEYPVGLALMCALMRVLPTLRKSLAEK